MLSVVVPAYREGPRLEQSLELLERSLARAGEDYEIIVVVDGGDLDTQAAARRNDQVKVVALPHQRGKGYAVRRGIREASGDVIVYIDADMELHPDGIRPLVDLLRRGDVDPRLAGADAAIGSKRHPDSRVAYPFLRRVQSVAFSRLVQAMFGLHLTDTQAGLKAFRADAVHSVEPNLWVDGFAFDLELLVALHDRGARIVEGAVHVDFAFESTTRLTSTARVLRDTISLWWFRRRNLGARTAGSREGVTPRTR